MRDKIDIGRVYSEVFDIYRDQAGVLLPAALVIFLIEAVVSDLLVSISFALFPLALAVSVAASTFYQGMVVELVSDVQDGRRDSSVGDLFRTVGAVVLPLIGAGILAGLGIALGFVLLIIPGLFLLTIWAVIAPVIVLERTGAIAAFGRSRELVRGNGWQVFGTIVLFFLILVVASAILGAIGSAFGDAGGIITNIISNTLFVPLVAVAAGVLYFTLRSAKGEGGAPPGAVGLDPGAAQPAPAAPMPDQQQPAAPPAPPAQQPPAQQPPGPEAPGQQPPQG